MILNSLVDCSASKTLFPELLETQKPTLLKYIIPKVSGVVSSNVYLNATNNLTQSETLIYNYYEGTCPKNSNADFLFFNIKTYSRFVKVENPQRNKQNMRHLLENMVAVS